MKKKIIIIIASVLHIIALFPFSGYYRDGGTMWFAPVTNIYRVELLHRLRGHGEVTVGTVVYIFGIEVFNDSHTVTE